MATATLKRKKKAAVNPVAEWRTLMGYTTRQAAEALGCSREALDGWEKGRHETPKYITLAMSALAMGMGEDDEKKAD
jgi:transcriptional regulator with XRE-family HTH domain